MKTFKTVFEQYNWEDITQKIYATTAKDAKLHWQKRKEILMILLL